MKFYLTGSVEGLTFKVGEKDYIPVQGSDGRYSITVSGIKSYELNKAVELVITSGTETATISYSPYVYAANYWENEEIGKLCQALVAYGDLANTYFNNN